MIVGVGGVPLRVRCGGAPLAHRLGARYGPFAAPPGSSPRLTLRLAVDRAARPPRFHPTWVDNPAVEAVGGLDRASCRADGFRARFDLPAGRAAAIVPDSLAHADLAIRIALSLALLHSGEGTLLHAAAVVRDGFGILFVGPSGAGKSTAARLCREAGLPVLADEMVVLRRQGAGLRVHGTPFWHGAARSAPAGALLLLRQAPEHAIERLRPDRALPGLLAAGGSPLDLAPVQRAFFETVGAILRRVPVYRLSFRPDAGFLGLFERLPEFAFFRPSAGSARPGLRPLPAAGERTGGPA